MSTYDDDFYKSFRKMQKEGHRSEASMRYDAMMQKDTAKLDTFDADLKSATDLLNKVYGGWQSADDMKSAYDTVSSMRNRLNAHKGYTNYTYSNQDLTDYNTNIDKYITAYDSALENWGALSSEYGKFKNVDAYENYKKVAAEKEAEEKKSAFDEYRHLLEDEEFMKNANYDSAKKNMSFWDHMTNKSDLYEVNKENKDGLLYDIDHFLGRAFPVESTKYQYLTDDELSVYYALHALDKNKADDFLDKMSKELNKRMTDADLEGQREFAQMNGFTGTVASIGSLGNNLIGGISSLTSDIKNLITGKEVDANDYAHIYTNRADALRGAVSEEIGESTDTKVLPFLYDTGMSIANSALNIVLLGGGGSLANMSTQAYSSKMKEMQDRGASQTEMLLTSALAAGIEAITEKIPMDNLLKPKGINTLRRFIGEVTRQAGIEAGEEWVSSVLNQTVDVLSGQLGGTSEFQNQYDDYILRGYTEDEAKKEVAKGAFEERLMSAIGGAISGGFMGGVFSGVEYSGYKDTGNLISNNNQIGALSDIATELNGDGFAEYVKMLNEGTANKVQIGSLYKKVSEEADKRYLDEKGNAEMHAIANRANELGDTRTSSIIASAIVKKLSGKSLSAKEKAAIKTDIAKTIMEEIRNEEITVETNEALDKSLYRVGKVNSMLTTKKTADSITVKRRMASMNTGDETIDNAAGNKITIEGIRTDVAGNTVLKTSAGERLLDDVTLSYGDAEVVAMAEGMDDDTANTFVSLYNGGDVNAYRASFDLVRSYGNAAFGAENSVARRGVLTEEQAIKVYEYGISERTSVPQKKLDEITEKHFADGGKILEGTFDDSAVHYEKLNSRQKAAASFAKMFSKATGVNVVLFESKADEKGVRTAENGRYEKSTNTVYIDVYAGFKENEGIFEDSMIPTMSHELTHWMKEKAPEAYAKLSEIVMDTLSREHNARPEVLVAYEKQNHKKRGRDVSDEYAQDELIARACEDMLSGNKTANEIIEQMDEETAKTFSEKFKEVIAKIRAWLKELLGVYKSGSEEAKILRRYDDKLAELQKAWDEGLQKAIKANQAMQNSETEEVAASERTQYADRNDAEVSAKIKADMTEEERYEVLKKRSINNIPVSSGISSDVLARVPEISSWNDINKYFGKEKRAIIKKLASEFGVLNKEYLNEDVDLAFEFSGNNFEESYSKQKRNYMEFAKMFSVFDSVIHSAVGIEVHNREDYKPDPTLENVFVLMSAYQDGDYIVPVKFEVKQFKDKQNTLYVAISLEKIKKTEVSEQGNTENGVTQDSRSVNISLTQIFSKINISDKNFLKYIPDGFLDRKQRGAKREALREQADSAYMSAVKRNDMDAAQKMVDEAAKRAGYAYTGYHGTKSDFTVFDKNKIGSGATLFASQGRGFYFTANESVAGKYAGDGKVLSSYLKIKNPFEFVDKNNAEANRLLNEFAVQHGRDFKIRDYSNYVNFEMRTGSVISGVVKVDGEAFAAFLQEKGYDGIIYTSYNYDNNKADETYVVFDSNQIKSADAVTYDDAGNVIPLSQRFNAENDDIRYSDRDSNGNGLTPEQVEFFKDSKVRDENGNLKVMYHGTAENFTVFEPLSKGGKNGTAEGFGIYFADTKMVSDAYGGKVMTGYLNITRPATSYDKTIKKRELVKLIKATCEAEAKRFVDDGEYENINEALRDTWISDYVYTYDITINQAYEKVAESIISTNSSDMDIVQEVMHGNGVRDYKSAYKFYDVLRDTLGIDGFITEWKNENVDVYSKIAIAFDSKQFKNIDNQNPTENEDIRRSDRDSEGNGLTKGQIEFFKNSKAVDKEGNLMVVYHGTVREFYTFDKQYANPEGNMGSGFYFTNDIGDVERNYANFDGPDFVAKLEHEAEMLVWPNSEDYVNEDGEYMDVDEIVEVLREKYATSEEPVTLKTYLNIQNPCYVGEHQTYLMSDISSEYDMEDFEDEDEYYEAVDQMASDYIDDIMAAVDAEGFYNTDDIPSILYDAYAEDGITLEDLKKRLNDLYIEGENGELVANEVARIIVEKLGYDGIIDSTVSEKFKNMGIGKGTIHYIVFNSNQAKLTSNQTPTSNEDIRYSNRDSEGNGLTKEQIEYFKDSKLRDENGSLKVMYHGTEEASFTVFDSKYANDGISLFFTDNKKVAKGYSGTYEEYIPGKKYTVDELTDIIGNSYLFVEEENGKYNIVRNRYGDFINEYTTDTLEEMQAYVLSEYASVGAGNYKVYLNLTNPLVVDADSNNWDEIPVPVELKDAISTEISDTRTIAKYAKEHGYDGVIFDNLYDIAVYAAGSEKVELSTVAVAFDSNQIKSVYNTNPTADPDIRYSERQTESIYDAVGELKRIQRENDKLKADIERLRKKNHLERTVTGGRELNESHIAAVAGHVLKMADSRYNKADFAAELKGIYNYLQGEDVTWEEFMSKATDVAQRIVAEAREHKVKDDYAMMILSTIRNARVSFNDTQKAEAEYAYGKNWNRNYFGRVTVANDGIPLESAWSEWASMYPDVFDADISDADMVTALLDIYDSTRTASEVVETYDKSEAARAIAFEIYNQFWNVSPVRTLADKHDKEVKRLKFEHRQEMKELRERKDAEVFETQWHYSKLIHEVREARDEKIAQLKKESREYTKEYREKLERRSQISQITKKALKLNKWLKTNSKDEHIVEELKKPVGAVLEALDFSSEKLLGTGVPTQRDISLKKAFEHLYKAMQDIEKRQGEEDYSIDMPVDYVEFLEGIKDQVNGIVERVGDNEFVLRDMTLEQLQDVNKMISVLTHIVTSANKALADANRKTISSMAQSTMLYVGDLGKKNSKVGTLSDFFNFDNGLPVYVFKMMGEGGQQIFRNMQNGWDKMAFHVKRIKDYADACYKAKEVKEWSKEVHDFTFDDGSEVKMTTAQIMSLYCLSKRDQARQHLVQGGMRVADFKIGTNKITNEDGALLLPNEIDEVVSKLTARQKEVADALQNFMTTVCSDWGNEVSMRRFGIKAFGEENYFPIQSDSSVLTGDDTPKSDRGSEVFRLLNMDFTKALNPNANNRIVVDNIFDVFATHTSDMAKYNALALPVLDMFRWYNYKESYRINPDNPEDMRKRTKSLKQSLKTSYGEGSTKYIMQFMKDINGAHSGGMSNMERWNRKLISNYKIAAVGANLRVAILQPTSYMRASAVISPKYLTAALAHKPQINKAKTTCGIALWKSLGFYDTNISRGVTDLIKHNDGWYQKTKEISMKLAEWGDAATWGYLYNACEAEIKDLHPELTGKAKDDAVALRLRDVIYATQVVDSTMTRTQNMRNPNWINQAMTAFMSEPSISYNMLHGLYIQYNADKRQLGSKSAAFKKSGKNIARVTASYFVTLCCASIAGGVIDAARDDDDEKDFIEKLFSNATENAISDMLSMLPGIKDVVSIYKGFNVGRMDMQGIQSTYYATQKLYKAIMKGEWDYKTVYSLIKSCTKAFSQNSGIPLYNAMRDAIAIWNNTVGEMYESLKL